MNIETLIATRLAATKKFAVVTTYDDGTTKRHQTETSAQAGNFAVGERRKIGRDLINSDGKTVRVVSVEIVAL